MMKRLISLGIMTFMVLATITSYVANAGPLVGITIQFGHKATSKCVCTERGGMCCVVFGLTPNALASVVQKNLLVEFSRPIPESALIIRGNDRLLAAFDDINVQLDANSSAAFGATSITIARGEYVVDYSTNPNGTVRLALKSVTPRAASTTTIKSSTTTPTRTWRSGPR